MALPTGQSDWRQLMAMQMANYGRGEPVRHPVQGLGRLAQNLSGRYQMSQIEDEKKKKRAEQNRILADMLGEKYSPELMESLPDNARGAVLADLLTGDKGTWENLTDEEEAALGLPTKGVWQRGPKGQIKPAYEAKDPDAPTGMYFENGQLKPYPGYVETKSRLAAAGRQPSQRDEDRAYYRSLGLPEEVAEGLVVGRYKIGTDPVSRQPFVMDMVSGEPVQGVDGAVQPTGGASPGIGVAPAADTPVTGAEGPAPDPTAATGASGAVGNIVNWGADLMGVPLPRADVNDAGRALNQLKADIMTIGAAEVPGRPSNFARELEGINAVTPFSLFETDQRSVGKLEETRNKLGREIQRMRGLLENAGQYSPKQVSETRQNLSRMEQLYNRTDSLIQAAGGGGIQLDEETERLLEKYR